MSAGLHVRAVVPARDVDVELTVPHGSITAILGPNGAGKSTLLDVTAGLVRPDHGIVRFGERVLTDTDSHIFVPPHRRGIALLAQQAMLFPHLTVLANVAFAPRSAGQSRRTASTVAQRWLKAVDATELADRKPAQLSGGQAQRIAVARALAAEPQIVLLDEPMAALDVGAAPAVRSLLRRVLRESGRTGILVTHDALDALALADHVAVLEAGRIVESGAARQVLTNPRSAFAARIAGMNLCAGRIHASGALQTADDHLVLGAMAEPIGVGESAVAVFAPGAVAVFRDAPSGSPRNVFPVVVTEIENRGSVVRVHGETGGGTTLMADVTVAAAADLDLVVGSAVVFVFKAAETTIHPVSR